MEDTTHLLLLKNIKIKFPFFHNKIDPVHQELINYLKSEFSLKTKNIDIYVQAFQHKSVAKTDNKGLKLSNERLEFLGDAVISSIVAEYIYNNYPRKSEGFLTQLRARIVSRESLNRLGKKIGLEQHIKFRASKNNAHSSLVGNVFESLIGSIYLDKGYNKTKDILTKYIFKKYIDLKIVEQTNTDYKSQLLINCQKRQKRLAYKELNKSKIEGEFYFTMGLYINDEIITQATAKSKRKAEQKASKEVLGNWEVTPN